MLSILHGIGVLLLNIESLFDSQTLTPTKERPTVAWLLANPIALENKDFHHYID